MTSPRRGAVLRRALTAVGVAGLLVLVGACSDDSGGDTGAPVPPQTVPSGSGDRCTDEPNDLDLPVGVDPSNVAPFAGIDLLDVAAVVEGDALAITFTSAGPIDDVPSPTFVVAQGEPLQAVSFELRLTRGSDGRWEAVLITWPSSREEREPVALDVVVDGSTLRTSLPLDGLPPIARTMQFGAASEPEEGLVVIDDCSNLTPG